jgi:hypothetical protein
MSAYKEYAKRIEDKLHAYDYFQNKTLDMLKISLDLGISYGDLFIVSKTTDDEDLKDTLTHSLKALNKAREGYDQMYAQYVHAMTGFWELREQVLVMSKIIVEYEELQESLKKEI